MNDFHQILRVCAFFASRAIRPGASGRGPAATWRLAAGGLGTAVVLSACTSVVQVDLPPARAVPSAFTQVPAADTATADLARWWQQWQDPALTQRVEQALRANADLRVAQARVREARALAAVIASGRYPTISARAAAAHGFGNLRDAEPLPLPGLPELPDADGYVGGVTASWEVDLFGARANDTEAAASLADAVQEQLRGTRIAIAGEVAQNYLQAQGQQRRLEVLDRSLLDSHALLDYVLARFGAGQATQGDVARVRERIAALEAERPALTSEIDLHARRLAVLAGETPQRAAPLALPDALRVPPVPAGELPAAVLERRPDVRASAALVRAQAARLGSAKADLLPRFYLTFAGLDGHIRLEGLPGANGTGGLFGIGADLPLFDAGRIRANIAANDARLQAALALHDKAMLEALEEVDSAYSVRRGFDARATDLRAAWSFAQRNADDTERLYAAGQRTRQDALEARLDALRCEDESIQAQTGAALATVKLYLALGGGWSEADADTVPGP